MEPLIWLGILFCISQSAMFSGLNLAFFSLGRLHLEAEAEMGCPDALKILLLRTNSNFLLSTILWGNVSANVALAMLSDSVMTGIAAFFFSTAGITFFGEIIPQAYFSRHALRVGSALAPMIKIYQFVLWPLARPSAWFLDKWIGKEGPVFFKEADFEVLLGRHIRERHTDISQAEGRGALNFLKLDDLRISGEGSSIAPETILPTDVLKSPDRLIDEIGKTRLKWLVLVNPRGKPQLVLNSDEYFRAFHDSGDPDLPDPSIFCHTPIVVDNPDATLDNPTYEEARQRYYRDGPVADWSLRFISAYASMHPWEDFAETFATYLDVFSVLDVANTTGLENGEDPRKAPLEETLSRYIELGVAINEINRSMGLTDLVPEVFVPAAIDKLKFVHRLVRSEGPR